MARWDSPLFTVSAEDDLPAESIFATVISGAKAPTNVAVLQVSKDLSRSLLSTDLCFHLLECEASGGCPPNARNNECHGGQSHLKFPFHDLWIGRRSAHHPSTHNPNGDFSSKPEHLAG